MSATARHAASRLWNQGKYKELTDFVLAVNLKIYKVDKKHIIQALVSTICPVLYEIKRDWEMATGEPESGSDSE